MDAGLETAEEAAAFMLAIATADRYREEEYAAVVSELKGSDGFFEPSVTDETIAIRRAIAIIAGVAGAPQFAFGQNAGQKTLVKVFLRGGADGLHLFPLVGDINYYRVRPNIAMEAELASDPNTALTLTGSDTMRAVNPNLAPLLEIWESGGLTLCPATTIDEGNRSHFDCQRWIGTGERNNLIDGYLNRFLQEIDATDHPLRGASLGKSSLAREISGALSVPSVNDSDDFGLRNNDFCEGTDCADNRLTDTMREISSHEVERVGLEGKVREEQVVLLEAIEEVQGAGSDYTPSAGGLTYSNSSLGRGLRLIAQLLKSGVPLTVASLDWNIGWDTHSNQIAEGADRLSDQTKSYHRNMLAGATDFLFFWRDMAEMRNDVMLVAGTEFGRTVYENGSLGTDHGQGGAWFAYGGPARSTVAPDVVNLADENLLKNRYVPNVVDYRDLIGEIMVRHMGVSEGMVANLFRTHTFTNYGLFRWIGCPSCRFIMELVEIGGTNNVGVTHNRSRSGEARFSCAWRGLQRAHDVQAEADPAPV